MSSVRREQTSGNGTKRDWAEQTRSSRNTNQEQLRRIKPSAFLLDVVRICIFRSNSADKGGRNSSPTDVPRVRMFSLAPRGSRGASPLHSFRGQIDDSRLSLRISPLLRHLGFAFGESCHQTFPICTPPVPARTSDCSCHLTFLSRFLPACLHKNPQNLHQCSVSAALPEDQPRCSVMMAERCPGTLQGKREGGPTAHKWQSCYFLFNSGTDAEGSFRKPRVSVESLRSFL